MKRLLSLLLCPVIVLMLITPAHATAQNSVIHTQETVFDNGLTVIDQVIDITTSRASDKSYARTKTIKDGDTVVAIITIAATFRYDGTTVSVVSKAVTQSDTYDGWEYVQNSFTSSGGTVTLDAKISKWFIFNAPFTMTLSCDKNGNISYT